MHGADVELRMAEVTPIAYPNALWRPVAAFFLVLAVVFLQKTAGSWTEAGLLPGGHIDGPFHFHCEYVRLDPAAYPGDLAVQSNRNLGAYDYFYAAMAGFARLSGLDLVDANMVVNWAGNLAYLAGVFVLLIRLGAGLPAAMLGTFWAAQRYVLVLMNGGVLHSLTIPREVALAPLPWLILVFITAPRSAWFYGLFFAGLGLIYTWTYPLWALIFGLMFGLASLWETVRARAWGHLAGLAGGSAACLGLVALTALGTYQVVTGESSAVLEYNQGQRWVYWQKGFRRFLMFALPALAAAWWWDKKAGGVSDALKRLCILIAACVVVCLAYDPLERAVPPASLLYLGRLALPAVMMSIVLIVLWFQVHWRGRSFWVKALTAAAACYALTYPLSKEIPSWSKPPSVQMNAEFVGFCRIIASDEATRDGLFVVEPERGTNYFRVYARRALWIHPKDRGILSRTHSLYQEGISRNETLETFFNLEAPAQARRAALARMRAEGVEYIVARQSALGAEAPEPQKTHGEWRLWRLADWAGAVAP
jgi:hypothetical protein